MDFLGLIQLSVTINYISNYVMLTKYIIIEKRMWYNKFLTKIE